MTSSAPRKTFPISWWELHRDARALAWRLMHMHPFQGLVAVSRGGLVPAAIIARELEMRVVDTLCISSDPDEGALSILKGAESAGDGAGWLVIDDLVDTGSTARKVREVLPRAHFATLYAKPSGRPLVDTYVTEVSQDTWILFPWDAEMQAVKPMVRG